MRWIVILVWLVGCRSLLGIESVGPSADAAVAPDGPVVTDTPIDTPGSACGLDYKQIGSLPGFYRLLGSVNGDWNTQRSRCAGNGATLAIPDDATELAALFAAAGDLSFWIGISDQVTEGVFETELGAVAGFLPWAGAQPNDAIPGQDCVLGLDGSSIDDRGCADEFRAMCECAVD